MRKKRVGILGGTFDPIHNAHLFIADEILSVFNLDKILFIPTGISWQKINSRSISSAKHRYNMVSLAIANNSNFMISDLEINRAGNTYTVDTLESLRRLDSNMDMYLILGVDAFSGIESWKKYHLLPSLAKIIVVNRGDEVPNNLKVGNIFFSHIPSLEISSTYCRKRIQCGKSIKYLVPDIVCDYIKDNNLYRS